MSILHQLAWSPVKRTCNSYPLQFLLSTLLQANNAETLIGSISQGIKQNTCLNLIFAPPQLGLGVQVHQQFNLMFLIESLHSHQFSLSYAESLRFERCTAAYEVEIL